MFVITFKTYNLIERIRNSQGRLQNLFSEYDVAPEDPQYYLNI